MKTYSEQEFNELMEKPEYQTVIGALVKLAKFEGSGHVPAVMSAARLHHIKRAIDCLLPVAVEIEGE
ncbi:MAG: hypothetical protein AAB649_01060 [Patescibacteria group bacterium]